jgi:hypothetical protein
MSIPFLRSPLHVLAAAALAAAIMAAPAAAAAQTHTSRPFAGPKVNRGTVTHAVQNGRHVLTLSDDFQKPDTPDPHWQIVDSKGNVFLLDRLDLKGDRFSRSITLPSHVKDIAKVQIYCAWAEVVLGETSFGTVMSLTH